MSPNPGTPQCAERCAEGVHVTAKTRSTCGFGTTGYLPTIEIETKAISYLQGKAKVFPGELAKQIGIHRNTSAKLCIYLWSLGKLLRDGRTYTWNPMDAAAADRIYQERVNDLLGFLDLEIYRRGQHNRLLANAYAAGEIDSCINKRQWTDTLIKARTRLRNCLKAQNPILLLDIEREIALDIPTWAGGLYKRTPYEQQDLTIDRRIAYAARKPRTGKDDAFHAARQARVLAKQRAAWEASREADRLVQAKAEFPLSQMGADPSKLGLAMQLIELIGPETSNRFLPSHQEDVWPA